MKLTTHLDLMLKLRMNEAIPLLLPYIFILWFLIKHRDFIIYMFNYLFSFLFPFSLFCSSYQSSTFEMYPLVMGNIFLTVNTADMFR